MPKKSKKTAYKLAPGEMELLEFLWSQKSATLAQTAQWFRSRGRNLAPTTVHTRLNRLVEKGIVRRATENPASYVPTITREQASGRYFEFFEMLCGQNFVPLMSHLAGTRDFTKDEIAFLEQLVKQKKGGK
jgi:predicted transcriptional regulator